MKTYRNMEKLIINTTRGKPKIHFATPQSPVDGPHSPVPEFPEDKFLDKQSNVVLNVFSKANYVHGPQSKSSISQNSTPSSTPTPTSLINEFNVESSDSEKAHIPSSVAVSSPLLRHGSKMTQKKDTHIENAPTLSTLTVPKISRQGSFGLRNGYIEKMKLKAPSPVPEPKRLPKCFSP